VTDQNGHPVVGVTVTFSVTAGGGSIVGQTQVTDVNGVATVGNWTLGASPGVNELQAAFNTGVSQGYTIFVATAFLPTWTQTLSGTGNVWSIATGAGGVVFAAASSGIYRSTDNGTTWALVGLSSVFSSAPSAVAVNPTNGHVFAGLSAGGGPPGIPGPFGGGGSGVYRSTDGGATWVYWNVGNPGAFGFAFTPGGAVIAATSGPTGGNGGLFISSDDGASWPYGDCCYPRSFAITSNGNVFAGDSYGAGGISRSGDAGATWVQVGLANTSIYSLVTTSSDHLFAGSASTGIYRSSDGVTWIQVNGTITNPVTSLAVGLGQVFAGVYGNGVLRSTDNGGTWAQFSSTLSDLRIEALATSANGLIFAGTPSGVFVRSAQ